MNFKGIKLEQLKRYITSGGTDRQTEKQET